MEFSNIWPYLEQSYSNKYNRLMTYGASNKLCHMDPYGYPFLKKTTTTQSNFRVIFFFSACLFLKERQSLTLAHCYKPRPICDDCWQQREKRFEADQSDRTMTRVRQKGKWCHAAEIGSCVPTRHPPPPKKKLKKPTTT